MLKSDSEQSDNFTSDRTRGQVGSSFPDVEVGILASPCKIKINHLLQSVN